MSQGRRFFKNEKGKIVCYCSTFKLDLMKVKSNFDNSGILENRKMNDIRKGINGRGKRRRSR